MWGGNPGYDQFGNPIGGHGMPGAQGWQGGYGGGMGGNWGQPGQDFSQGHGGPGFDQGWQGGQQAEWGQQQQGWGQQGQQAWGQQPGQYDQFGGQMGGNMGGFGQPSHMGMGGYGPEQNWGGMGGMGGMGGSMGGGQDWFHQDPIVPVMQVKEKDSYGQDNDNDLFGNWLEDQKKKQQYSIVGPNVDVGNLINQQVVFIQPSPVQKKIEQLKRTGRTFEDTAFPPNMKSLTGEWGVVSEWKSIQWKKISELLPKVMVFDDKIQPDDIKQGYLGDCYFLAALAALAQKPARIFNLFLTPTENPQKYYACKILYKGKWKTIDIDEYIPTLNNAPAFSKAMGPQVWVVLLEKAWSKLYSSYKRIEAGYPEEGLHDLTGAHIQAFRTKAADFDKQEFWRYLLEGEAKDWAMIASSQPGSDTNTSTSGIVLGHAYTLLGAYDLQGNRLVKLRNPWGKTESKSEWNDNDPRWSSVSHADLMRLGFNKNANDGTFFLNFNEFCKEFRMVTSAEVNDSASYVYLTQKSVMRHGNYFRVEILRDGLYSFQINQIPERAYEDKLQNEHEFQQATILIGKVNGNMVEWYEGSQSAYRTLFKKHKLPAGQYIVYGKIFFSERWEKDYELTLAVYGEYPCRISNAQPQDIQGFKEKLYAGKCMKNPKQARPGVFYGQEILKEGYVYSACINQSNAPVNVTLQVQQNSNPTVHLKKPFKGQNYIQQQIAPGGFLVILARVKSYAKYTTSGIGTMNIN